MILQKDFDKIQSIGKELLSDFDYKLQEEYYINLYLYFSGSNEGKWDIKKGLLICGDIGTGKTLSIRVMQNIFRSFGIINSRYLVREYLIDGIIIAERYGRHSFKTKHLGIDKEKPITWCFDDFGIENINSKNYGNQINIMEEILLDRYDMFICHGMKTIITTNFNPELIEENYGKRVRDRLKETMNYITLTGQSLRK